MTNDVVAVIELVKNAYDAFAARVEVRFGNDPDYGSCLEIQDDGCGMDRRVIEDVWCMVATPFRAENPESKKGKRVRRVAGEKGLGRLSAARLGQKLDMLTKAEDGPCWRVSVDWSELSLEDDLESCGVTVRLEADDPFKKSGTLIRISQLKADWDDERVADLEDNLRRLVSPFRQVEDFRVFLTPPGGGRCDSTTEVSAPDFLSKPPYAVRGSVADDGSIRCMYHHSPIKGDGRAPRNADLELTWDQIARATDAPVSQGLSEAECGAFEFDIRAWDIGAGDTEDLAETFHLKKSSIRGAIRAHKGISVYRDGILVLPKSEDARDWLGLDLRRVSKVGTRLSTSQIVGYVSISADGNPHIQDTSNREGLASNDVVKKFQATLRAVVYQLENERDRDRLKPTDEERLTDLFEDLTAEGVLAELMSLVEDDAPAADAVPMLREFSAKLDSVRAAIKKRFTYYSRLATIGTIAQMLVHEIRNRTTAFGRFLRRIAAKIDDDSDEPLQRALEQATFSVDSLERLADIFAPLASKSFRRRRRSSVLEDSIRRCLGLVEKEIEELDVKVKVPGSETQVAVDPGELDAVLLNLVTNAIYWLRQGKRQKALEFSLSRLDRGRRVRLVMHDSGPGVPPGDAVKVFLPGVTRKPGGIGMGLTVASELVAEYGGQMRIEEPGKLGGASFSFDVPVKA